MKILITCLSKSWGGMEMQTILTAEVLTQNNIDAEILCCKNSKIHERAESKKIPVNSIESTSFLNPFQIRNVSHLLHEKKFDLVHSQASKDLWLLVQALIFSKNKIPLLLTKHVGSFIIKKDFLHKWIYSRVTYALAISEVIKRNLVETTPLPESKVLLLHNGIDTEKFSPAKTDRNKVRNEFNIGNRLLIGMTARFSPGKGHEEFLQAAQSLCKKYGNLIFMIVGEPSYGEKEYTDKIHKLCDELKLNERVIFTGYRNDMPDVYSAMDIFVFPSHAEAFGLALVEAMSLEKPSICSRSDGVLDIAIDGKTSYLFEKQNGKDLTDKIELLIQSEEKRREFGKEARKRAVEMFDIKVFAKKLIEIYKKATN